MIAWRGVALGVTLAACGNPNAPSQPIASSDAERGAGPFSGVWVRIADDGRQHGVVIFPDGDAFEMKLADCRASPIDERAHRVVVDASGAFLVIDGQKAARLRLDGEVMTLAAMGGDTSRRATATRSTVCKMPAAKPVVRASDDLPAPPPK